MAILSKYEIQRFRMAQKHVVPEILKVKRQIWQGLKLCLRIIEVNCSWIRRHYSGAGGGGEGGIELYFSRNFSFSVKLFWGNFLQKSSTNNLCGTTFYISLFLLWVGTGEGIELPKTKMNSVILILQLGVCFFDDIVPFRLYLWI